MEKGRNQNRTFTLVGTATPAIDFDGIVLKKGQRAPKGYRVIRLKADAFPNGWPLRKPYHCECGCGKTYRIDDRVAARNTRKTGGMFLTLE